MQRFYRGAASLAAMVAAVGVAACDVAGGGGHEDRSATAAPSGEPGAWRAGEEWRLVEEARIGSADGDAPEVFGSVVDVALDAMGRVWVADGKQQQIRVFGPGGAHVRSIGRKGNGPREFAGIAGMDWAPDGRLWVLDGGNSRFAVYDTAGTFVETHARRSILTTTPWPGRFDVQNRLYDVTGEIAPDHSIVTAVVRSRHGAQGRDTFRLPAFQPETFRIVRGDARNRLVTEVGVPFTGTQLWQIDQHGYVWVANTARYRLERHAFAGGIERVVGRPHEPVPVSRAERDRMLENYRGFVGQGGTIDQARIPAIHPALHGFIFDDAGHVWVSPATRPSHGRVLDVFELTGRYLGRVPLPAPPISSPKTIRGNRLVVVAKDSLDVPTVLVLRIEKPGG